MSANYCEARHEATGVPETHCFHATGEMKKPTGLHGPKRPIEECCWCSYRTFGLVVPKEHGPRLAVISLRRIRSEKAGKKR